MMCCRGPRSAWGCCTCLNVERHESEMVDGARAVISKWTPIIASEGMLLHRRGRESRRSEAAGCTSLATGTGASVTACTGTRPVRGPQPSASGCPRAAKELPFTPEDVRRRGIWRLNAYTRSRLLGSRLRTRAPATPTPYRYDLHAFCTLRWTYKESTIGTIPLIKVGRVQQPSGSP